MSCEAGSDASSAANALEDPDLDMTVDQFKELLRTQSATNIGGKEQLHLVAKWMDSGDPDRLDRFINLLPLIDLKSVTEEAAVDFFSDDNAIAKSAQCRCALNNTD